MITLKTIRETQTEINLLCSYYKTKDEKHDLIELSQDRGSILSVLWCVDSLYPIVLTEDEEVLLYLSGNGRWDLESSRTPLTFTKELVVDCTKLHVNENFSLILRLKKD